VILVDPHYAYILENYNWTIDSHGYPYHQKKIEGKRKNIKLHKVVLWCPDEYEIDHVNGNKLDNRLINLRIVTRQQNSFNKLKYSNNSSGYKGVYLNKRSGKYSAEIKKGDIRLRKHGFKTPEEADKQYKTWAKELHGEYTRI